MADALKHFFDAALVRSLAREIGQAYPALDQRRFVADAVRGLEQLELTARGAHIAEVLRRYLPPEYERAVRLLVGSLPPTPAPTDRPGMAPFRYLPHVCFVARYGLGAFDASMAAQYELTQRFTAEFSIRPFLLEHREQTLERLERWARDPNVHVRRLVSEGTRPRLPWAARLPPFQKDPAPVLRLLELLKDDPERYVQRSVANNLNDIAKDHPQLVVETCRRWSEGASPARAWVIRHALRSLLKAGHPGALALVGAGAPPEILVQAIRPSPRRLLLGGEVAICFELKSASASEQDLLIDHAVHFVRANGERRPKVFKLKRLRLAPGAVVPLRARVSFADKTTRKHYPGRHAFELRVNGVAFPLCELEVRPAARGSARPASAARRPPLRRGRST